MTTIKVGFIPGEAKGAIPNGTRIRKKAGDPDDTHPIGALGTVLSSIEFPKSNRSDYAYFIKWDDMPGVPMLVVGFKIERLSH